LSSEHLYCFYWSGTKHTDGLTIDLGLVQHRLLHVLLLVVNFGSCSRGWCFTSCCYDDFGLRDNRQNGGIDGRDKTANSVPTIVLLSRRNAFITNQYRRVAKSKKGTVAINAPMRA
jgi:hypothetical protein